VIWTFISAGRRVESPYSSQRFSSFARAVHNSALQAFLPSGFVRCTKFRAEWPIACEISMALFGQEMANAELPLSSFFLATIGAVRASSCGGNTSIMLATGGIARSPRALPCGAAKRLLRKGEGRGRRVTADEALRRNRMLRS